MNMKRAAVPFLIAAFAVVFSVTVAHFRHSIPDACSGERTRYREAVDYWRAQPPISAGPQRRLMIKELLPDNDCSLLTPEALRVLFNLEAFTP